MDPLCTVPELETYLRRSIDTDVATLALVGASGIVRDYCRWQIAPAETVTFIADGTGTHLLGLPTLRLTAVDAVRVDGAPVTDYTWSVRGHLYRAAGWPGTFRSVEVDCAHGHDHTPDAVRAVVLSLAANGVANPERLKAKTVGGTSRQFSDDMSELQLAQIAGHRLP